ncbi:MAG: hypothetical protein M3O29_04345 [Actinomycetota bacterium]|nr:hypothetical protein [Actinomycetota bacterium]
MSEVSERLDEIAARAADCQTYNFGLCNAEQLAHNDVPYLLDLARKQAAALEAVTARLDDWAAMKPFPDAEETQVWYSAGKRHASEAVRAIITEALEATL